MGIPGISLTNRLLVPFPPSLSLPPGLPDLLLRDRVKHQLPGVLSGAVCVTQRPVVPDGVGEEGTVPVEARS